MNDDDPKAIQTWHDQLIDTIHYYQRENAACLAALKELTEIIDEYVTSDVVKEKNDYPYYKKEYEEIKSKVERAKRITNGQQDKD